MCVNGEETESCACVEEGKSQAPSKIYCSNPLESDDSAETRKQKAHAGKDRETHISSSVDLRALSVEREGEREREKEREKARDGNETRFHSIFRSPLAVSLAEQTAEEERERVQCRSGCVQ